MSKNNNKLTELEQFSDDYDVMSRQPIDDPKTTKTLEAYMMTVNDGEKLQHKVISRLKSPVTTVGNKSTRRAKTHMK